MRCGVVLYGLILALIVGSSDGGVCEDAQVVGVADVRNGPIHAAFADGLMYVGVPAGMDIVDVSDPASPVVLSTVDFGNFGFDVAVEGGFAYVAAWDTGLVVVDVSDPASPVIVSKALPDDGGGVVAHQRIVLKDGFAFLVDSHSGIDVFDVGDPVSPEFVEHVLSPGGAALGVEIVGDVLYLADQEAGVTMMDVSDAMDVRVIGSVDTPGFASGLDVDGGMLYVADFNRFVIFDLSDPVNPVLVGTHPLINGVVDVSVGDGVAYVSNQSFGVQMFDIRDPSEPGLAGNYAPPPGWQTIGAEWVEGFVYMYSEDVEILSHRCGGDCVADLSGDGLLNFLDVSQYLLLFGEGDSGADFSADGALNFLDVSAFLVAFGEGCP